ncbi:MAG: sigma-54-dependent Fis family transcriptional regulator [Candidatus Auribacter fodinae]|jgi:DNA-binding NtrC family response regulator|uniref:Sigma-54-dependent Fis family transcriptional regulator n=1 Tax=Candidatus Auribacter fodinae TaxID=2093366 RepID=A0A3A4R9M8_9BACT|nr:MAG: sigma-54-dependent Fis family transcriptional regulator [Candidatus Auribacter fodinae]
MPATVLIVDDESSIIFSLSEAMQDAGYRTLTATRGEEAIREVKESSPDIVLLDMKLPDIDGLKVLKQIKSHVPELPVIMMSAYVDVATAVQATKIGAVNFIEKPLNIEKIKIDVNNTLKNVDVLKQLDSVKTELEQFKEIERLRQKVQNPLDAILGNSKAIRDMKKTIKKIVDSSATTVLVQGESGSGKELVARAIHYASNRKDKPFIDVNCTSIPDELLESELFGHEKGAFTDAKKEKKGLFELANGGTLFLDEIGDMKFSMQAKLLRVLQEKFFKRVGGTKNINIDVRIVAATNKDLLKEVEKGNYREDLYYRLNVIPIYCPPLRQRGDDVILLTKSFVEHFNKHFGKNVTNIDSRAEELLLSYSWPGNVRELRNIIERAILLESEDVLLPEHLSITPSASSVAARLDDDEEEITLSDADFDGEPEFNESWTLDDMENWFIQKVLVKYNWNKNLVAKKLGINRTTLYTKIKKYNLER